MQTVSNQYAAMPSLHIAWSTWCALVMWQLTRKRWARVLIVLYPVVTLFGIVVTANHYWLDGGRRAADARGGLPHRPRPRSSGTSVAWAGRTASAGGSSADVEVQRTSGNVGPSCCSRPSAPRPTCAACDPQELDELAGEIRDFIVPPVAETGGHLGSNLGAVELTLALHRVFDSPTRRHPVGHRPPGVRPQDRHRTRRPASSSCARPAGCPATRRREESEHDFVENSHASTILSYAYGLAVARDAGADPSRRHIVAVIGDGSMTGGMAYEALNNLGHSDRQRHHRPQRQRPLLRADDVERSSATA